MADPSISTPDVRAGFHRRWTIPFAAIVLLEFVLSRTLNTTWEWDAVTRAAQASDIAAHGVHWYFFTSNTGVWLPLWQLLLAGANALTGLNPLFLGEILSCFASAGTCLYVLAFMRREVTVSTGYGVLLLLCSAYFVGSGSQAMTEALSVFLFVSTLYHVTQFQRSSAWAHLVAAALLALLHSTMRYEGWLFVVLISSYLFLVGLNTASTFRDLVQRACVALIFAAPTLLFIAVWSRYQLHISGQVDFYRRWVFENNEHEKLKFYRSAFFSVFLVLRNLCLACGLFWPFVFVWKGNGANATSRRQPDDAPLFAFLLLAYSAYVLTSAYTGYNSGWVRHFLYLQPLAAIAFAVRAPARWRRPVLVATIAIAIVSFGGELRLHAEYVKSGRWPGNAMVQR